MYFGATFIASDKKKEDDGPLLTLSILAKENIQILKFGKKTLVAYHQTASSMRQQWCQDLSILKKKYDFLLLTATMNSCPDTDMQWNFDRIKGFPCLHIKEPVITKGLGRNYLCVKHNSTTSFCRYCCITFWHRWHWTTPKNPSGETMYITNYVLSKLFWKKFIEMWRKALTA